MNRQIFDVVLMTVVTTMTGVFIVTVRANWKIFKSLKSAQKALIKDRIVQAHDFFCQKGAIGKYSFDALEEMNREYVNLGGNGFIKKLMDDLRKLPIL